MTIRRFYNDACMAATDGITQLPWVDWLDLDIEYGGDGSAAGRIATPQT